MAKQMDTNKFTRLLRKAGCSMRPGKGSHSVFYCPPSCGEHMITVNLGHGTVAPNAMRDVKYKLNCVSIPI